MAKSDNTSPVGDKSSATKEDEVFHDTSSALHDASRVTGDEKDALQDAPHDAGSNKAEKRPDQSKWKNKLINWMIQTVELFGRD